MQDQADYDYGQNLFASSNSATSNEPDEILVDDDFGVGLRCENRDLKACLIWASVGPQSARNGVWMGLGLLSDNGLPFCSLHQFLAAKIVSPANKTIDVLLADAHAVSTGEFPEVVARRADVRHTELLAIEKLLGIRFNVMLASEIAQKPLYRRGLETVRVWTRTNGLSGLDEYSILGIADDLYFSQEGRLKIGWSYECQIREGRGRHHEAETDLIARRIQPEVGACYVRHGVRLDSHKPTGVPYTEIDSTADRLMLTGRDSGEFRRKLSDQRITSHRRTIVTDHLAIAVKAFEGIVMPLAGDIIAKAEAIHHRLTELLGDDVPRRSFTDLDGNSGDCRQNVNIIDILQARGLIHQCTDLDRLREHLSQPRRIYCGFDPTAPSLTIGNLVPLIILRHLQSAGHTPVIVLGGGTGLIGDPSGKAAERPLLSEETLQHNLRAQRPLFEAMLDSRYETHNRALYFDNAEWLSSLTLLKALRDIGKYFSVNQLIQRDSIRDRMGRQQGISVTEFLYSILQAWDFKVLYENSQVTVQLGGADQWTNIISGIDLVRRLNQQTVYGITCPLVTRSDGGKFGKTEAGPIWLSADKTSPYQLFQFFMNQADEDAGRFLRLFTFLPLSKIEEIEYSHQADRSKRLAQRVLAQEVTTLIHGPEAVQEAGHAADAFFKGDVATLPAKTLADVLAAAPTTHHQIHDLVARPISAVELMCLTAACSSKREARELLSAGAITVNGKTLSQSDYLTSADLLHGKFAAVRRGRKNWFVGVWE